MINDICEYNVTRLLYFYLESDTFTVSQYFY